MNSQSPKRINYQLLMQNAPSFQRRRNESIENGLARITHLNLNDKGIEKIENLEACANLHVLYLYDNCISEIENLEFARHMTQLHIGNNQITVMEGLPCTSLQKLYLDGNYIANMTGLLEANCLQELHLANQKIEAPLSMDPASVEAVSSTLKVLNVANCHLVEESVGHLLRLVRLEKLNVAKNAITDANAVLALLSLRQLAELDTRGNPCCRSDKYDQVTIAHSSARVRKLDNKEVTPRQRQMMQNLISHRRKAQLSSRRDGSRLSEGSIERSRGNSGGGLPGPYPSGSSEAKGQVGGSYLRSHSMNSQGSGIPMSAHFDVVDVGGLPYKDGGDGAQASGGVSQAGEGGKPPLGRGSFLRKGSGVGAGARAAAAGGHGSGGGRAMVAAAPSRRSAGGGAQRRLGGGEVKFELP